MSAKSINHSLEVVVGNSITSKNTRGMPEAQRSLTQIQESIYPDFEKENSQVFFGAGWSNPSAGKVILSQVVQITGFQHDSDSWLAEGNFKRSS